MEPAMLSSVEPRGELGERLKRSAENMLSWAGSNARNVSLFGDPASYCWGPDYQGRWLEAMTLLSRSVRLPKEDVERVAENLVKYQRRDGNFHTEKNNMVLNGNSRALVALVEHYRTSGRETCLESAVRLAEWYIRECGPESHDSSFLTMVLEGFVELWAETGEDRYLGYAVDLAERTFRIWTDPLPPEGHFHSMLASLRAVADLFLRLGDRKQLKRVEVLWELLRNESVWLSGGLPEISPCSIEADEPCTTGDWLRFCLLLWRATGKSRYLDDAERTLLNHLFFNQLPNGGYSSTCNLEQGFRGIEAWWCCSMQAPRSVLELARHIWTHGNGSLYLNFLLPSRTVIQLKKTLSVTLLQEARSPAANRSTIRIDPERPASFALKIRVPDWTGDQPLHLRVNGKTVDAVKRGKRLTLRRRWKPGDRLEITLPTPMRLESDVLGTHAKWSAPSVELSGKERRAKRVGAFRGPLLSVVVRTGHQNDMPWVYRGGYNELLDCGGMEGADGSSRNYFRINGQVYDDQARQPLEKLCANPTSRGVIMTWKERLTGSDGPVAEVHYRRLVRSAMPVVIEEEETLVILGRKGRPVLLQEALMAGIRVSQKAEQYHDTYCRIWKYEYPALQVQVGQGRFRAVEDGKRFAAREQVVLDNGLFRVEAKVGGVIEQLVTVRRERWSGLYFSPIKGRARSFEKRQVLRVKATLRFPFRPYSERTSMPAEWTSGLMTQPINEI